MAGSLARSSRELRLIDTASSMLGARERPLIASERNGDSEAQGRNVESGEKLRLTVNFVLVSGMRQVTPAWKFRLAELAFRSGGNALSRFKRAYISVPGSRWRVGLPKVATPFAPT